MTPIAYSRETAAEASSFSKDEIDRAIRAGALKAREKGRRVVILREDLEAWLHSFPEKEPKAS